MPTYRAALRECVKNMDPAKMEVEPEKVLRKNGSSANIDTGLWN